MRSMQRLSANTPDTIRHELLATVEHLLILLRRNAEIAADLDEVCGLLELLPLAADEYQVASNRMRNARWYLAAREQGAAHYELQLLERSLLQCRETTATRPRICMRPLRKS